MTTLLSIVFALVLIVSGWRMFEKAGLSGWVALIPIVNVFGALKMAGRPFWWAILFLIPVVNVVVHVIVSVGIARSFGKSAIYGLVMAVPVATPFCVMSLGLGSARYLGAAR